MSRCGDFSRPARRLGGSWTDGSVAQKTGVDEGDGEERCPHGPHARAQVGGAERREAGGESSERPLPDS